MRRVWMVIQKFNPYGLRYPCTEVKNVIVTTLRWSLARFDPPASVRDTPTPGCVPGPVVGFGSERVRPAWGLVHFSGRAGSCSGPCLSMVNNGK